MKRVLSLILAVLMAGTMIPQESLAAAVEKMPEIAAEDEIFTETEALAEEMIEPETEALLEEAPEQTVLEQDPAEEAEQDKEELTQIEQFCKNYLEEMTAAFAVDAEETDVDIYPLADTEVWTDSFIAAISISGDGLEDVWDEILMQDEEEPILVTGELPEEIPDFAIVGGIFKEDEETAQLFLVIPEEELTFVIASDEDGEPVYCFEETEDAVVVLETLEEITDDDEEVIGLKANWAIPEAETEETAEAEETEEPAEEPIEESEETAEAEEETEIVTEETLENVSADSEDGAAEVPPVINKVIFEEPSKPIYSGWTQIGAQWHFFDLKTGTELETTFNSRCFATITDEEGNKSYSWFKDGKTLQKKGWKTIEKQKYYADPNGILLTGFFTDGKKTYYLDPNDFGRMVTGEKEIDGKTYLFDAKGVQYFGWKANMASSDGWDYYDVVTGEKREKTIYLGESRGWATVEYVDEFGNDVTDIFYLKDLKTLQKNGFKKIGAYQYYFDAVGRLLRGKRVIAKKEYILTEDTGLAPGVVDLWEGYPTGAVQGIPVAVPTGWKKTESGLPVYYNEFGRIQKGWFTIGKKTYCALSDDGAVEIGLKTVMGPNGDINTYYFDAKGVMKTGWQTINKKKYYFETDGAMVTGYHKIANKWYFFDDDGTMWTGVLEQFNENGTQYLTWFDAKGVRMEGWKVIDKMLYYFDRKTGEMLMYQFEDTMEAGWATMVDTDLVQVPGMETVYLKNGLKPVKGKQKIDGKYYFFTDDSALVKGFYWMGKKPVLYYSDYETGELTAGAKTTPDGETVVTDANGKVKLGWVKEGTEWSFYDPTENGAKRKITANVPSPDEVETAGYEWVRVSDKDGDPLFTACIKGGKTVLANKALAVGNSKYYFDAYGRLKTGTFTENGKVYHTDEFGHLIAGTALSEEDGQLYAFKDGVMLTGKQVIDGKTYYFNKMTGAALRGGIFVVDGQEVLFDKNGVMCVTPVIKTFTASGPTMVKVSWDAIAAAEEYLVQIAADQGFEDIFFEKTTTDTSAVVAGLAEKTYYARIAYFIDDGEMLVQSAFSPVKSVNAKVDVESTEFGLSECSIERVSDNQVNLHFRVAMEGEFPAADDQYYIVKVKNVNGKIDADEEPLGSVTQGDTSEIVVPIITEAEEPDEEEWWYEPKTEDPAAAAVMSKYGVAVKALDGSYILLSKGQVIGNPEAAATGAYYGNVPSKKGVQGLEAGDPLGIAAYGGAKNTLWNLSLNEVYEGGDNPYVYKGKTYRFGDPKVSVVKKLNSGFSSKFDSFYEDETILFSDYYTAKPGNGLDGPTEWPNKFVDYKAEINVSMQLLLEYSEESRFLIDPQARNAGHHYYMLNMDDEEAVETYEAMFAYLGEIFGKEDCYISNWILGNEVNAYKKWNWIGSNSTDEFIRSYSKAYRLLYSGVKKSNSAAKVYACLDHSWTTIDASDGVAGKTFLDKFVANVENDMPGIQWNVAYHPYPVPLTSAAFYNDSSHVSSSVSSPYITMKNIEVLTDYLGTLEKKYNKPAGSVRCIVSEVGFTCKDGEDIQAKALAYAYYKAEFNDRIDAFIIRAQKDEPIEVSQNLSFGLTTTTQKKRESLYVFKYMDAPREVLEEKNPTNEVPPENQERYRKARALLLDSSWAEKITGTSWSKICEHFWTMPISLD